MSTRLPAWLATTVFTAGLGADKLVGGRGDDRLRGDGGQDKLIGGAGDDLLLAKDGAVDKVDCGPGADDIAVVDPVDLVSVDCEQKMGQAEEPSAAVLGPPAPTASSTVSVPSLPTQPPEEKEKEEENSRAADSKSSLWRCSRRGTAGPATERAPSATSGPPLIVNIDRSFGITTEGNGEESIATSPLLDPVDLTNSHVSVQAQISFSSRLDAVRLRLVKGFHVVGNVDWSRSIARSSSSPTTKPALSPSTWLGSTPSRPSIRQRSALPLTTDTNPSSNAG